jgi:hypothetical protein
MVTAKDRPVLVDAGPGTEWPALYRARPFQSRKKLAEALVQPDQHLGPPPPLLANAGRMNARGISVFYGANDPEVAIAEVRPPVGSWVAVAKFDIIRPIKLLDLTALTRLRSEGSYFDPGYAATLERRAFLRNLSQRIARPVMPDDEAFDYLATQAVADFLATEHEAPVDGIIFVSAQKQGKSRNVVLFHKAATVEAIQLPEDTEVSFSAGYDTADGWEDDYSVVERASPKDVPAASSALEMDVFSEAEPDHSPPPAALRIDLNAIDIHEVRAVSFDTDRHRVERRRYSKIDNPDF